MSLALLLIAGLTIRIHVLGDTIVFYLTPFISMATKALDGTNATASTVRANVPLTKPREGLNGNS